MKKFLSIIAFVLLLTVLVACGDKPEEVLASAKDELLITFASGDSATSVTKDLETLPSAIGDVVVTWKSSNTTYLANDGKVTRGMADVNVTMEATLTFDGQTLKVPFALTIKGDSLDALVTAFETSYADTLGDDEFEATANLNLVTTFDGATVTWTSNNTEIITNAGVVTRPIYADGDQTVILTAELVKGLLNAEVEFLVFVPKMELTIQEKLQQALAVVTAFPVVEGISEDQEFLTTAKDSLNNDYTVVWTSSHPDILSAAGVVNQPLDADVVVTMTASITVGTVTESKTVTFNVFKKVDTTIFVDTIAEGMAAVVFPPSKFTTDVPFEFSELTVIGQIANGYVMTDGVDVVLFDKLTPALTVGSVYVVNGAIYSDFGVWRIRDNSGAGITASATLLPSAVAKGITPTEVADLDDWLADKPAFNQSQYFRHDYIRITARVYVQADQGSSYDTWLVSPDWTGWNNSEVKLVNGTIYTTPTIMVHYRSNIATLRALDGKVITFDAMVHSYRTDKLVWYINFLGTTEDIELVLNDQESVDAAETQVKSLIAAQYIANTTVTLPTSLFGATIEWSSDDQAAFNTTTGAVKLPTTGLSAVKLTAVITKNAATKTVDIFTNVGDVQLIDIADLYETTSTIVAGDFIKIKGLLVAQNSTSSWWIQDATGGLNIYVPSALRDGFALYQLGIEVEITGKFGKNNGLFQIQEFTAQGVTVTNNTPVALPENKDISAVAFTNEALYAYMGQLVSFDGFVLKETVTATSGYINIVLINPLTGAEIPGFLHTAAKGYAAALAGIKEFVAGDTVNVTGTILGWSSNKYQIVITGDHFSAGADYTEAQLAAYAESKLVVPAADAVVEGNLTLPATGLFGSTVAWTSTVSASITTTGTVTRGDNDVAVTLGYALTLGATTLTEKTIAVTVKAAVQAQGQLMIYEVYGGGGDTNAVFKNDYVVLYNGTSATVNLANYSLHYSSATGNFGNQNNVTMVGTIEAGKFIVVKLGGNTSANGIDLPHVGVTAGNTTYGSGMNMAGSNGTIALVGDATIATALTGIADARIVDLVGFGTAPKYEGTAAVAALSVTNSGRRTSFVDLNQNGSDFAVITLTATSLDYVVAE